MKNIYFINKKDNVYIIGYPIVDNDIYLITIQDARKDIASKYSIDIKDLECSGCGYNKDKILFFQFTLKESKLDIIYSNRITIGNHLWYMDIEISNEDFTVDELIDTIKEKNPMYIFHPQTLIQIPSNNNNVKFKIRYKL